MTPTPMTMGSKRRSADHIEGSTDEQAVRSARGRPPVDHPTLSAGASRRNHPETIDSPFGAPERGTASRATEAGALPRLVHDRSQHALPPSFSTLEGRRQPA